MNAGDEATIRFSDPPTMLITGAGGLIGSALTRMAVRQGYAVVAIDATDAILAAADLPDQVHAAAVDLRDQNALLSLAEQDWLGEVDVLVHAAGVLSHGRRLLDTDVDEIDDMLSVNVRACILISQVVARDWVRRGHQGAIVTFSSPGATRAHDDQAVYDASKGAVEALTRAMAVEWGRYGIRVNAVAPAAVAPVRTKAAEAPLGTGVSADDVASAVLWLASAESHLVTGHTLAVDGGLLARLRATAGERP